MAACEERIFIGAPDVSRRLRPRKLPCTIQSALSTRGAEIGVIDHSFQRGCQAFRVIWIDEKPGIADNFR